MEETRKMNKPILAILAIIAYIISGWSLSGAECVLLVFLCLTLFLCDRDKLLLTAIGLLTYTPIILFLTDLAQALFEPHRIYYIFQWCFSEGYLLRCVPYAALFIVVLALGEQKRIEFKKPIVQFCRKYYFFPAVISILLFLLYLFFYPHISGAVPEDYSPFVQPILFFFIGRWMAKPSYAKEKTTMEQRGYCSLGKHIALCLFTCGVWPLIWTYRTTAFLNKAPKAEPFVPVRKLLLCMFVPFYQIYWFYVHGQRIDSLSRSRNLDKSDISTLCVVLAIFIPFVAYIIMQDRINAICVAETEENAPVVI